VKSEEDNTVEFVYGGDMLGNVWRFDFDDRVAPSGREAFLLGTARSPSGSVQPITVTPLLAEVTKSGSAETARIVLVGTGRYLGSADLGDTTVQSLYAFHDRLDGISLGNFRSNSGMVAQSMNASHVAPTTANVDWFATGTNGWYIDFNQSPGERVNVEMDLQLDQLTVATTVPTPTPCSPGGTSWLYYFDIKGGLQQSVSFPVLVVGFVTVMENSGQANARGATIAVFNDRSIRRQGIPFCETCRPPDDSDPSVLHRTSWRELIN